MLCGRSAIGWDSWVTAMSLVLLNCDRTFRRQFAIDANRTVSMGTMFKSKLNRSFGRVLVYACHHLSTDPRDIIFALLGHPSAQRTENGMPIMFADYSKSVEDVYWEVTVKIIEQDKSLDALRTVWHSSNDTVENFNGLPSWAHRWDHACEVGYKAAYKRDSRLVNPNDAVQAFHFDSTYHALFAQGFIFDDIKWISSPISASDPRSTELVGWRRFKDDCISCGDDLEKIIL